MIKYLIALLFASAAHLGYAGSAIWEVSNGSQKLWLGASLGGLKKSAYPLPAEFDDAFRRADKLYVERDIHAISQPDFAMRAMQASVYRDGRNLKSALSPALWQKLESFARERSVPMFSLLMFKPAFAGFTLTVLESKRLELANGVDAHYFNRATNNNKPIATLETVEQQLQFLQTINEIDANVLISTLLEELTDLPTTLDKATRNWRIGNMEQLDQLKGKKMRSQAPALYQTLVVSRSKSWLPQFKAMLKTAETEYVLVDVVHLTGPNNLLQLLKAEGFTVKPYVL